MKKVTVKQKMDISVQFPFFLFQPILWLWPLLSFVLPALVVYGLMNYGMPMVWISDNKHSCTYLDPIGYVTVSRASECDWYAFRRIQFPTLEGF